MHLLETRGADIIPFHFLSFTKYDGETFSFLCEFNLHSVDDEIGYFRDIWAQYC